MVIENVLSNKNIKRKLKYIPLTGARGNLSGFSSWDNFFSQLSILLKFDLRSEDELIDSIEGETASILTPVLKSSNPNTHYISGDKTRSGEHLFDGNNYTLYLKFLPIADDNSLIFSFGGASTNARRGIEIRKISNTQINIVADDDIVNRLHNSHVGLTLTAWTEIHITINGATKELISTIVHVGGTSIKTMDISTFTFNNNDNYANYGSAYVPYAICNIKKFSNIVSLANTRLDSYITGLQIWLPELLSGIDVSTNNNHFTISLIGEEDKYYCTQLSYLLDKGYSVYRRAGDQDFYVPHDINNNAIRIITFYNSDYVYHRQVTGRTTKFNMADAMIEFTNVFFDRSDTDIYEDEARLNFYDVANPKRWHSEEINRLIMSDYFKSSCRGRLFPRVVSNSYEERDYLDELILLTNNVTSTNYSNCLDYSLNSAIERMIYLKKPYTYVPQITANEDSEFKLRINNSIFYSYADIKGNTDLIEDQNEDEDFVTKLWRWALSNSGFADVPQLLSLYQNAFVISSEDAKYLRLPFIFLNSYPFGRCLELAQFSYGIMRNYYDGVTIYKLGGAGHAISITDDVYYGDVFYGIIIYKEKYQVADMEEIIADKYLWTEPLKMYDNLYQPMGGIAMDETYWGQISGGSTPENFRDLPDVDNMTMKLPVGAVMTLPVKTINIPQNSEGNNLQRYNHAVVTSATGVAGEIDMPFLLLQITGTGSVTVDDIDYTLPVDEASLTTVLQSFGKFYHGFTIQTNTGGIEAEYLVSPRLLQLYKNNTYSLSVISGDVSVGKTITTDIVPTSLLNVDTNDDNVLWSLTQDKYLVSDSILKPKDYDSSSEERFIFFYKEGLRPKHQAITANGGEEFIVAGAPIYDTLFASIITPKVDEFSVSLEITLTSVDDANIYYTTDGTDPDETDNLYTDPFTINATTTIKAICIKTDYGNSNIIERTFTKV